MLSVILRRTALTHSFFPWVKRGTPGNEARKRLGRQPHHLTSIWMGLFVFQFLKNSSADKALADALGRSQAVIEFGMDGTILTANDNFLKALGYSLGEIQGKHHSMFVDPSERDSAAYRDFWAALKRGEYQAAEYKRIGKGGKEVWIQATYNPVLDASGKPVKVVKFATDITARKIKSMEDAGQISAIGRAQAVIAFEMDGTIVTANENFLKAMGYSLAEIQGKHHSMFVEQATRDSAAYREFWARLNRGENQSAEYKRIGKGGKEVWILASYNPVLDEKGKPFRVVKFATDVTKEKLATADLAGQIARDRQIAGRDRIQHGRHHHRRQPELPQDGRLLAGRDPRPAPQHVRRSVGARRRGLPRILGGAQPRRISGRRIQADRQGRQGGLDPGVLQSDPRSQRQAVQGRQIRHRHHRAGAGPHGQRARARHDGIGRRRRGGTERLGSGNLRSHDQVARDRIDRGRAGRGGRRPGQAPERGGAGDERHRRTDRQHHRPDQPSGAERDDRIGACRRGRARLCRGGVRGQEPRQPGQAGDRQDRAGDRAISTASPATS